MPHYTTYGGTYLSSQPADELTGTFDALNETTNFRPSKGESISIVHPAFKTGYDTGPIGSPVELNSLDIGPVNKTADKGWWTVDGADFRDSELDALNETTNFDPRILGPISGESESDNHFTPDRGGDAITGDGRPMNVWTNGSATSFEDRLALDYDANDAVFSMRENVDWTAANGGPGSSYLAAKTVSQSNAYVGEDSVLNWLVDGDMKLGDIVEGLHDSVHCITEGCGQNAPIGDRFPTDNIGTNSGPGGSSFMTETFEPAAGMDNFGESLNPVPELGGKSGPGGTSF